MLRSLARRWPRLRPLLPAVVVAAGWGGCTSGDGPLVAFLGDSLTSGWRLREVEAYPALVGRALRERGRPIRVVNAGRSGDTALQGLARLPAVLKLKPDVVVVALGINDALRGMSLTDTEAALERIIADSRASGARVLLVGFRLPPEVGEAHPRAGLELYPRLAAARRIPLVIDLLAGVQGRRELLFPDLLHPNTAGHMHLAENVRPQLELLLAELEAKGR
jgi:acyl-CoA thioesterase-1